MILRTSAPIKSVALFVGGVAKLFAHNLREPTYCGLGSVQSNLQGVRALPAHAHNSIDLLDTIVAFINHKLPWFR